MSLHNLTKTCVFLLGVLLLLVAGTLIGLPDRSAHADDATVFDVTGESQVLAERYFDGKWAYAVAREPDGLVVVEMGIATPDTSGITTYYDDTVQMSQELFAHHETADVFILFQYPVVEAQLPSAILDAIQDVKRYGLELRDSAGKPFYIGAERNPNSRVLVDYADLHRNVLSLQAPGLTIAAQQGRKPYTISGYSYIEMTVNQQQFQQLLEAPSVLAVDIGPALALMDAGLGTHRSQQVSVNYPLSHLRSDEIEYLTSLK